jgi:hypothetical protein
LQAIAHAIFEEARLNTGIDLPHGIGIEGFGVDAIDGLPNSVLRGAIESFTGGSLPTGPTR